MKYKHTFRILRSNGTFAYESVTTKGKYPPNISDHPQFKDRVERGCKIEYENTRMIKDWDGRENDERAYGSVDKQLLNGGCSMKNNIQPNF